MLYKVLNIIIIIILCINWNESGYFPKVIAVLWKILHISTYPQLMIIAVFILALVDNDRRDSIRYMLEDGIIMAMLIIWFSIALWVNQIGFAQLTSYEITQYPLQ